MSSRFPIPTPRKTPEEKVIDAIQEGEARRILLEWQEAGFDAIGVRYDGTCYPIHSRECQGCLDTHITMEGISWLRAIEALFNSIKTGMGY